MPITGGSGAQYRGVRCPVQGGQVPITGGSGAHYRGVRCPLSARPYCMEDAPVPYASEMEVEVVKRAKDLVEAVKYMCQPDQRLS